MKKFFSIFIALLAVICCVCIFTSCGNNQTSTANKGTHYNGDCQHKGFTRYTLPNGEYRDVPDENFGDHRYESTPISDATCSAVGEVEYTCSVCGDTYISEIPMIPHEYDEELVRDATCTQKGEIKYTCSVCDDTYKSEIPMIDHDYEEEVSRTATCTQKGEITYTCSVCGDNYTEDTDKIDHSPAASYVSENSSTHVLLCKYGCGTVLESEDHTIDNGKVITEATCEAAGVKKYQCTECDYSYTDDIAIQSHSYESEVTEEPSCSSLGIMTYTCSVCSDSYTEDIPKNNHVAEDKISNDGETHWQYCVFGCGEKLNEHSHSLSSTFVSAICIEHSYNLYECDDCEYSYKEIDEDSPLISHRYEAYTCVYCGSDLLLAHLDEFENHGNSNSDAIIIDSEQIFCSLIDYITVNQITTGKHFILAYVDDLNTSNYKNYIDPTNYVTSTNWGYSVSYYSSGEKVTSVCLSFKNEPEEHDISKIATISPNSGEYENIVYDQVDCFQFYTETNMRSDSFDDFPYYNRRYEMSVTTSEQLFYAFAHGYKPIPVADSAAELILDIAKEVSKNIINDEMSDIEKIRAIYMWLVQDVQYDYGVLQASNVNWRYCSSYYLEGVFLYNIAVCDGISKAFCVLAGIEDIKCIRETSHNHAWNKVWIDIDGDGQKEWYCSDATWGNQAVNFSGADGTANPMEILSLDDFLFTDEQKIALGQVGYNYKNADCDAVTAVNPYAYIYYSEECDETCDYVIASREELIALFVFLREASSDKEGYVSVDIFIPLEYCLDDNKIQDEIYSARYYSLFYSSLSRITSKTTKIYGDDEGYTVQLFITID